MFERVATVVARSKEEARQIKNERQREYDKRTGYAAQKKYSRENRKNTVSFLLRMYTSADSDVIEHLEGVENKSAYIKDLIRGDMKKIPKSSK